MAEDRLALLENDTFTKLESKKAKESLSNHLRKKLKLDKAAITLLYEVSEEISASVIKNLPTFSPRIYFYGKITIVDYCIIFSIRKLKLNKTR